MENELKTADNGCPDGMTCGFQLLAEEIACVPNGSGCTLAFLAEAELSDFHDQQLADATQAIKNILAAIPSDTNGRKLSFIKTSKGFLLTWVDHSGVVLENALTQDSDNAAIVAALKLKT